MKLKLLVLLLLVTSAQVSWAQMEKGSWFLRGNAGIELGSTDFNSQSPYPISNSSSQTFTFSPGLGYMVQDHWMVGVEGIFKRRRFESQYIQNEYYEFWENQFMNTSGFGLFARRFFDLDENLQIFAETGIGMSGYSSKRKGSNTNSIQHTELSYREYEADLAIGIHYRIVKNLSIEMNMPLLGYSARETKSRQNSLNELHPMSSAQSFSMRFGSNFQLGINFIF